MSTSPEPAVPAPSTAKPAKPAKPPQPAPAPTPGVVVTHRPNGIVITNYTGAR